VSTRRHLLLSAVSLALILSSTAYANTNSIRSHYALIKTLHLPGPTHWDFLVFDSKAHRLFITRSERVDVLDTTTDTIIGSIPAEGAHSVAFAQELGKGFISNGKSNTITIFDLKTLKAISTVPTGTKPDSIVYDADSERLFVANADSGDMTAINAVNGAVVGTIKLDGQPEFAVVDGKGKLYVNLEDKSQLAVLDTKNLKVMAHYNLAPQCEGPTGLALDAKQQRLFSVCANKTMVVVDATIGTIANTLPIGAHSDAALFDPETKLTFSSNGDGTLTVVDAASPDHYKVLQTVPTKLTARTMALNPTTHQIYMSAAQTEGFDPPTEQRPEPRPHIKPDTFMILTVGAIH
jgi:YVTN family beta-propeller protein